MTQTLHSADPNDPPAEPLQLKMIEKGSTVVVQVAGMAAVENAGKLSRILQEAAALKPSLLAVDLSELSFISSTGLGSLIAVHVTCQKNGTKLCLINPQSFLREILNITKLNQLFETCDSLADAEQLPSSK